MVQRTQFATSLMLAPTSYHYHTSCRAIGWCMPNLRRKLARLCSCQNVAHSSGVFSFTEEVMEVLAFEMPQLQSTTVHSSAIKPLKCNLLCFQSMLKFSKSGQVLGYLDKSGYAQVKSSLATSPHISPFLRPPHKKVIAKASQHFHPEPPNILQHESFVYSE